MKVTAHVTLEEGTDVHSGRNRACMKAIAYLTEAHPDFGPQTELVDVTARKGKRGDDTITQDTQYGYFEVEVTYLAESKPFETEHIEYPNL
jgi:hypothetical protein